MILDKVIIWRHHNGNIAVTSLLSSGKRKDETEEEFIQREITKLKSARESLNNASFFIKNRSEVKYAILQHPDSKKRSLRIDPAGNFYHDMNYKTFDEIKRERKNSVRKKLETLGILNEDDIDLILDK